MNKRQFGTMMRAYAAMKAIASTLDSGRNQNWSMDTRRKYAELLREKAEPLLRLAQKNRETVLR